MSQTQTAQPAPAAHVPNIFANTLCAVDGSPGSLVAVAQATELVGEGGRLTLLEVTSGPDRYQSPAILPAEATRILDEAAKLAQDGGVKTHAEVDPDCPPARIIVDWAADYSMLAMGAPLTSWLAGAHDASTTDSAISALPTALLVAREHARPSVLSQVVVATDGAAGSDKLVALATEIAQLRDAEVSLVHAKDHRSRARGDAVAEQGRSLRATLGAKARSDIRAGKARTAIMEAAGDAGASLIVMGSRGLHGLRAIGSVSRHVMHEAPCSVLLIPPG